VSDDEKCKDCGGPMAGGGGDRFCWLEARTRILCADIAGLLRRAMALAKNDHHDNTGLPCGLGRYDCCDICAAAERCKNALGEFDDP
jgi:hypothetical protein